jgi:hypothetical protein
MNIINNHKNKGGRPRKEVKRDILLAVMVNALERKLIENKALEANLCISIYLREMGLNGAIYVKEFNKELLKFLGTLNNIGGLLNQIAKKRNSFNDLDAIERATLNELASDIAKLTDDIRGSIK